MNNYQIYSEANLIHKLIKPGIYTCDWTEDNMRYDTNAGAKVSRRTDALAWSSYQGKLFKIILQFLQSLPTL